MKTVEVRIELLRQDGLLLQRMHDFGICVQGRLDHGYLNLLRETAIAVELPDKLQIIVVIYCLLCCYFLLKHFTHLQIHSDEVVALAHANLQYILIQ